MYKFVNKVRIKLVNEDTFKHLNHCLVFSVCSQKDMEHSLRVERENDDRYKVLAAHTQVYNNKEVSVQAKSCIKYKGDKHACLCCRDSNICQTWNRETIEEARTEIGGERWK